MFSCPRLQVRQNTKLRISGICPSKCLIISCTLASKKEKHSSKHKIKMKKYSSNYQAKNMANEGLNTCRKWSYLEKKRKNAVLKI